MPAASGSVSGQREVSEGRKGLRRELRTLSSQALVTIMAPRRGLVLPQLHVKGHGLEGEQALWCCSIRAAEQEPMLPIRGRVLEDGWGPG